MKVKLLLSTLFVFCAAFLFSKGLSKDNLVNTRRFLLQSVEKVTIDYGSDEIAVFETEGERLVLQEYMSVNNKDYFAITPDDGNGKIYIKGGRRPSGIGVGFVQNNFEARAELYVPLQYEKSIDIRVDGGRIKINGNYSCENVNLFSNSGNITIDQLIAPQTNIDCRSGTVNIKNLIGDLKANFRSGIFRAQTIQGASSITSTSGSLHIENMDGNIDAETTSGAIRCSVTRNAEQVFLTASSGSIRLFLPKSLSFYFSSDVQRGSLKTPFQYALHSPSNEKGRATGVIGEAAELSNVILKATSGAVRVDWR